MRRHGWMLAWAVVLGGLSAACTPLGLARGDYWAGMSTGDVGACPMFDFVNVVIQDDRVDGWATTGFDWGTAMWQVRGLVAADRRVVMETTTDDPRVASRSLTWTGAYNPLRWELVQSPTDPACATPRSVKLQRK